MLGEDFAKLPPNLLLKTALMNLDGAVEVIAALSFHLLWWPCHMAFSACIQGEERRCGG